MKPQELDSRSQVFPSRPGCQARAQPNLCSMPLQAKADPGGSIQPALPHSCTLGPLSGRKARLLKKCRRGSEHRNRRGKTKVGWVWVARIIQDDLQATECLNLWCWNINTSCLMLTCHKHVLNSQFQQIVQQEFRRSHFLLITPNKKNCEGRCEHRSKQK